MKNVDTQREILRFKNGRLERALDTVATEFPVTLKVNGQEWVTMVCTPEYIEDMAVGYLVSERVVRRYEDIRDIWTDEKGGFVHVRTDHLNPYYEQLQNKRYITSCCGMSRQAFVFVNDALAAKKMDGVHVRITVDDCFRLMEALQENAEVFKKNRGRP